MFLIRQPTEADVPGVLEVAKHLDTVNLPARRDHIQNIVDHAVRSFSGQLPPEEREFLFVLEDQDDGRIVGTSMIHAQHGTKRAPHVYFQVIKEERYSQTLDRFFRHECLRLGYDYDGPTEIGGLILLPSYRGNKSRLGTLLSYMRFLFIAMHRSWFRDEVISELLPPLEDDGTSKLWEHLGKRFTGLTYQEADLLSKDNKEFIHALFPHGLIYTSLFPDEVRELIGKVGDETRGVEKILKRIGFRYGNQIDPFDGGPHFTAATDSISLVRDSKPYTLQVIASADESRPWAIVAAETPELRAIGARVIPMSGGVLGVTEGVRRALAVSEGDEVWAVLP